MDAHTVGGIAALEALFGAVGEASRQQPHRQSVFFQCARALQRSKLWQPVEGRPAVPTAGAMLQALTDAAIDGAGYDAALPARQRDTLY